MGPNPRFGKDATHIRVKLGESFVLELPALATAGYLWRVTTQPDFIALRSQRLVPASAAIGAPAMQEFEFTSLGPGEGTLALEYCRSWEATSSGRLEADIVVERESSGV